ncbi:glycosyltransferase family 2 protein [Candidatus Saccharibacteria bacterium]|nr:glycosyltransferase family 2 protein [Candidatus Saccharibacteria bacterium]
MKKISVIVPVYNREKFIKKCLDSLLEQKGVNLEIIVVDNNSKDKTPEIVKGISKHYSDVKYYNCKKQGVSAARNYGLEKAGGEYISFVDSDDYCKPGMFKALFDEAKESNAVITCCGIEAQDENGNILQQENQNSSHQGSDCVKKYLTLPTGVYAKLIKKSYLDEHKIKFHENISLAEDLAFVAELAAYTELISFINGNYYVYIEQKDSLMHHIDPDREYQVFEALGYIYGIYDKKVKLLNKYHDELERMFISNLVLSASTRYMIPEGDKRFYEQALSFLRTHFSEWYKNRYYAKRGLKIKVFFYLYRHGHILKFRKLITRIKR